MHTINLSALYKSSFLAILLTLGSMLFCQQAFSEVKASLNQQEFYQGDVITLKIESDRDVKSDPELNALNNNFEIKGRSANSQISIINGSRSYKKTWNIELQAKTTGRITIPEINLGNENTEAIVITVKELPPEVAAETKKHIFLESEVDIKNDEIYVQQQIPYTIKFYYDSAMQTGEVILPTIENANLRVVGKEKQYQEVRADVKYVVVERRYVVSPEKSGRLVIPPTKVQGRMALTNGDSPQLRKRMNEVDMLNELFFDLNNNATFNNTFDPFFSRRSIGPTRPYTAESKAIEVNVLPVPESFTGAAWLPAEEVIMQDSWTTNPPGLKVGEPVTRSIVMQVKGLASSQIPEIYIPKPAGMRVYPEQAEGETPNDGNTVYGIQRIDISYIPDKSGAIIIPEINVDWWDVINKQQQTYTLPEWNLNVAAGTSTPNEVNQEQEAEVMADLNPEPETSVEEVFVSTPRYWGWNTLLALILLIGFVLFSIVFISKRFSLPFSKSKKKDKEIAELDAGKTYIALQNACKTNNDKTVVDLLIKYATIKFPDEKIHNLGTLKQKLKTGATVITELETNLYSANSSQWNGEKLLQLISQGLELAETVKPKQFVVLAPLYPS